MAGDPLARTITQVSTVGDRVPFSLRHLRLRQRRVYNRSRSNHTAELMVATVWCGMQGGKVAILGIDFETKYRARVNGTVTSV